MCASCKCLKSAFHARVLASAFLIWMINDGRRRRRRPVACAASSRCEAERKLVTSVLCACVCALFLLAWLSDAHTLAAHTHSHRKRAQESSQLMHLHSTRARARTRKFTLKSATVFVVVVAQANDCKSCERPLLRLTGFSSCVRSCALTSGWLEFHLCARARAHIGTHVCVNSH